MQHSRHYTDEELIPLIQENLLKLDKDFDKHYTSKLVESVLSLLQENYFRSMFVGFNPLPKRVAPDRPLIYVSNHSGMSFPWDAMIFLTGLYKLNNHQLDGIARPLVAPLLAKTKILSPFMLSNLWRKVGCLEANMINFETLLSQSNYNVMIFPEGAGGISKGFEHKYELQHMSTSFVRMAVKYKTDIIPFSTVNGEYINPNTYTSEKIDKLMQKLGIPFMPLGGTMPWMLLQPWLMYNAFPSKLTYVMGKRIKHTELTKKAYNKVTEQEFEKMRDKVANQMQTELLDAVKAYGGKPYHLTDLAKHGFKNLSNLPYLAPSGWPLLFKEFDRQYKEHKEDAFKIPTGISGFFDAVKKNPKVIPYFIPLLGWIPILMEAMMEAHQSDDDSII